MRLLNRIAAAVAVCVALGTSAWAQNPSNNSQAKPRQNAAPARVQPGAPRQTATQTQNRTVYRPTQYQTMPAASGAVGMPSQPNRSVLHHYPYSSSNEYAYGFRNPGGVGRYEEYYPPGNSFQSGGHDPVTHAGFDQGMPVGSIDQQAMAYNAGTARYSAFQQHMDNFSRPMGGFGYGFGGVGAF